MGGDKNFWELNQALDQKLFTKNYNNKSCDIHGTLNIDEKN
jgi:hypothetical protein